MGKNAAFVTSCPGLGLSWPWARKNFLLLGLLVRQVSPVRQIFLINILNQLLVAAGFSLRRPRRESLCLRLMAKSKAPGDFWLKN
jgi:hypothetical protein